MPVLLPRAAKRIYSSAGLHPDQFILQVRREVEQQSLAKAAGALRPRAPIKPNQRKDRLAEITADHVYFDGKHSVRGLDPAARKGGESHR
jgi:hypothetical protein